ncbi:protein-disulfide reductase DsbD domain-containing protein [Mesorhizobium marinum]|uniref:Protein-disulfide reductase DsbD domain-containing protein n=1 Tax=Mesorhizobium marinum TaxID=3228790 RepID=A0ABV3R2C0_9HYPH
MKAQLTTAAALALLAHAPAHASSSDWVEMEGARVRLVTAGMPDADGRIKGILDIELRPGWKTYWRDPGDAGVPPTIDVSANPNVDDADFDFPAPQRHDDSGFQWAGYDYPVALPVTFTLSDPAGPSAISAEVFLGVCETICVPVQARFELDASGDPDNTGDVDAVEAAFEAVPPAATQDFGVRISSRDGDRLVLEASFPGDPESAELFVAGEGHVFTTPVRETRGGKTFFSVEMTPPDQTPERPVIHYTLATDAGAVNGVLPRF